MLESSGAKEGVVEFTVDAAGFALVCSVTRMGADCLVALRGGDKAHIGSVAMAHPRPSLTGAGRSATVSTLNRMGHKDDFLANPIAQKVAARMDCTVACAAGVHVDDATPTQIAAIQAAVPQVVDRICAMLEEAHDE
jgi:hypothetical protein